MIQHHFRLYTNAIFLDRCCQVEWVECRSLQAFGVDLEQGYRQALETCQGNSPEVKPNYKKNV